MAERRVFLLELLSADRFAQNRSAIYPFVRGHLEAREIPVYWACFGFDPHAQGDARFRVDLPPEDVDELVQAISSFGPTHVLSNELLGEEIEARIQHAAPRARLLLGHDVQHVSGLERRLRRWLSLPVFDRGRNLVDAAEPAYRCELVSATAREVRPFVSVLAGPVCFFRAPIEHNPAFEGVRISARRYPGDARVACSFCAGKEPHRYLLETPAVSLALRQIRGALEGRPAERWGREFLMHGAALFAQLGNVLEGVLETDIPASHFYFYCRFDELLRKAKTIEALLPKLAAAGHGLHLFAMGAENFSPAENQRFNKRLDLRQIEEAVALLRRWEAAHPGTLGYSEHGELSFILFTPWTRVADLRANLQGARQLGLGPLRVFFTSRLQIFDDRTIHALARHDGVLADEFDEPVFRSFDSGCVKEEGQVEVPWRFLHSEVAAIYGVHIRLWPVAPEYRDDPLYERIQSFRERAVRGDDTLFDVMETLLDIVEADRSTASAEALWERFEAEAERRELIVAPDSAAELEALSSARAGQGAEAVRRGEALVQALASDPRRPLEGYLLERAEWSWGEDGWGELLLTLVRAGVRMGLYVSRRREGRGYRLTTTRFGLAHDSETALSTSDEEAVAKRLLQAFEDGFEPDWLPKLR